MPGLIDVEVNKDPNKIATYDPERIEVEERDTVQGQLADITAKNSPLNQVAKTRAKQAANKGGLINTSMAIQAGQQAVLDSSLPIASADADKYYNAKTRNQDTTNTALQFGAASKNQRGSELLTGQQALDQIGARADQESRLQAERTELDKELMSADTARQKEIMARQAEIDKEMAEIQQGYSLEQDAFRTEAESRLMAEQAALDKDVQAAAIAGDTARQKELMGRQAEIDKEMTAIQQAHDKDMFQRQAQLEKSLLARKGQIERSLVNAQGAVQSRLMAEQAEIDKELTGIQNEFQSQRDQVIQDFQSQQNRLERDFQGAENAAARDAERDKILTNSASELMRQISGQNATFMDAIGQINAADLESHQKSSLINKMSQMHLNNLNTTQKMADFSIVDGKVEYNGSDSDSSSKGNSFSDIWRGNNPAPPTYQYPDYR